MKLSTLIKRLETRRKEHVGDPQIRVEFILPEGCKFAGKIVSVKNIMPSGGHRLRKKKFVNCEVAIIGK